jgi:hypothetical protein
MFPYQPKALMCITTETLILWISFLEIDSPGSFNLRLWRINYLNGRILTPLYCVNRTEQRPHLRKNLKVSHTLFSNPYCLFSYGRSSSVTSFPMALAYMRGITFKDGKE